MAFTAVYNMQHRGRKRIEIMHCLQPTRAQRRKLRLMEQERNDEKLLREELANIGTTERAKEHSMLQKLLLDYGLEIYEIPVRSWPSPVSMLSQLCCRLSSVVVTSTRTQRYCQCLNQGQKRQVARSTNSSESESMHQHVHEHDVKAYNQNGRSNHSTQNLTHTKPTRPLQWAPTCQAHGLQQCCCKTFLKINTI